MVCFSLCCSFVHVDDDIDAQALDAWSCRLGKFYKFQDNDPMIQASVVMDDKPIHNETRD